MFGVFQAAGPPFSFRIRGTLYGRCTMRTPEGQTWGRFSQKRGKKGGKWQPTKTHENARKPHKTRLFTRSRVLFAFAVYIHFEYGKRPYFCGLQGSEWQTRGKMAKQKTGRGDPSAGPLLNYEGDGIPPRYYYNMRCYIVKSATKVILILYNICYISCLHYGATNVIL